MSVRRSTQILASVIGRFRVVLRFDSVCFAFGCRLGQQDAPDDFSKNALDSGFLAGAHLSTSNGGNDIPEEHDARNVTTNLEK
jgi:hypothetical protein